jgi:hypothetical protein
MLDWSKKELTVLGDEYLKKEAYEFKDGVIKDYLYINN